MKPTVGLVSTSGIVPISKFFDSPGPMGKSALDVALLLDILVDAEQVDATEGGYTSAATGKWDGLRIGTLDPKKWTLPPQVRKILDPSAEEQLVRLTRELVPPLLTELDPRCPKWVCRIRETGISFP
jgi:amidase